MIGPGADDPHVTLLDDARHGEAVAERSRRRLLAEAEELDATFPATLRGIAEQGGSVLVDTSVGRTVRGRVHALGTTHVALVDTTVTSYVRVDGIAAVRAVAGDAEVRVAVDDAPRSPAAPLQDVLVMLATERSAVDVHLEGGTVVRGTVRRVGSDVLTVRVDATGGEIIVNLPLAVVITAHRSAGRADAPR